MPSLADTLIADLERTISRDTPDKKWAANPYFWPDFLDDKRLPDVLAIRHVELPGATLNNEIGETPKDRILDDEELSEDLVAKADNIWNRLRCDRIFRCIYQACYKPVSEGIEGGIWPGADAERLHVNSLRFFAAGIATLLLRRCENECVKTQLPKWLSRIVSPKNDQLSVLNGSIEGGLGQEPLATWTKLRSQTVEAYRDQLDLWIGYHLQQTTSESTFEFTRTTTVPFVSATSEAGTVHELTLYAKECATKYETNKLLEYPDLWDQPLSQEFCNSVEDAFNKYPPESGIIVWKLEKIVQQSRIALTGNSHAAAAHIAFRIVKEGKDYDMSCIVSAGVASNTDNPKYTLTRVEDLKQKFAAAHPRFSQFVVASVSKGVDDGILNALIAEFKKKTPPLEIICHQYFDEAYEQATGLISGMRTYLKQVVEYIDHPGNCPVYLNGRKPSEIAIDLDVLVFDTEKAKRDNKHLERKLGVSEESDETDWHRLRDREHYRRVPWRKHYPNVRCGVIIGCPGEGKTWLTRQMVRELASNALAELGKGNTWQQVKFPILLSLPAIAEIGGEDALKTAFDAWLTELATVSGKASLTDSCKNALKNRMFDANSWLVLDSLDEVTDSRALKKALARLGTEKCHVFLTTRPYGYDDMRDVLPNGKVEEFELDSLSDEQRRQFIKRWTTSTVDGKKQEHLVQAITSLANGQGSMRKATENILLLTLACYLAESEGTAGTENPNGPSVAGRTRSQFYYDVVTRLLRGEQRSATKTTDVPTEFVDWLKKLAWDTNSPIKDDAIRASLLLNMKTEIPVIRTQLPNLFNHPDCPKIASTCVKVDVEAHLERLERLAWEICNKSPEKTRFLEKTDWRQKLKCIFSKEKADHSPEKISQCLDWWKKCGLIVSCGTNRGGEKYLAFLHRTFLEYLVGAYMANPNNPIELVSQFLWQPEPIEKK